LWWWRRGRQSSPVPLLRVLLRVLLLPLLLPLGAASSSSRLPGE
jgi:hypothetical protein